MTSKLINKIAIGLQNGTMAIWCGAGISIPSGLPGANKLVEEILAHTSLNDEYIQKITKIVPSRLPFERFMEVILDAMDEVAQKQLLKIFTLGEPSFYHIFLARLAKLGMLKTICTTNFDSLVETALNNEKLTRGVDYEVYEPGQQFEDIDWNDEMIRLVKLHGSVENLDKLAITVNRVAAPGSIQQIYGPVKYIFDNSNFEGVLILGYSFSDRFDLSPAISQQGDLDSSQLVINFQYTSPGDKNFKVEQIKFHPGESHPLSKYKKHQILFGDTEEIIREMCIHLKMEDINTNNVLPDWIGFLNSFFRDLDIRHNEIAKHYLAGAFLSMIGADGDAIPYYNHVIEISEESQNNRWKLLALQSLAGALLRNNEIDNALAILRKAEPIALEYDEGKYADHVLAQLSNLYYQMGNMNIQHALQYANSALKISEKDSNALRNVPHLANIAACWMQLGDFDAAQKAYSSALVIVENSGDLYRRAEVYGNIASMAYIIRDYESAMEWYEKAHDASKLAGDIERQGIHIMNKANVFVKQQQYDIALTEYSKAKDLIKQVLREGHPILKKLGQYTKQVQRLKEEQKKA